MKIKILIIVLFGFMSNILFAQNNTLTIGDIAPEIKAKNLKGDTVKLSSFKGKVIALRFWQRGCYQCIVDMPKLQAFQDEYRKNFIVLAVNSDNPIREIKSFQKDYKITYPLLKDEFGQTRDVYGVTTIPTMFIINKDGIIKEVILGDQPWYQAKLAILRHLK